jgi:hypothetical protein
VHHGTCHLHLRLLLLLLLHHLFFASERIKLPLNDAAAIAFFDISHLQRIGEMRITNVTHTICGGYIKQILFIAYHGLSVPSYDQTLVIGNLMCGNPILVK